MFHLNNCSSVCKWQPIYDSTNEKPMKYKDGEKVMLYNNTFLKYGSDSTTGQHTYTIKIAYCAKVVEKTEDEQGMPIEKVYYKPIPTDDSKKVNNHGGNHIHLDQKDWICIPGGLEAHICFWAHSTTANLIHAREGDLNLDGIHVSGHA